MAPEVQDPKIAKNSKLCYSLKTEITNCGGSNGIGGWKPVSPGSFMPQNNSGSAGPENLLKVVSCVECEKLQELMVLVQME